MIQISGNFAIGSNRVKISCLFKFEIWNAEGSENAMKATGGKKQQKTSNPSNQTKNHKTKQNKTTATQSNRLKALISFEAHSCKLNGDLDEHQDLQIIRSWAW